jgi:16S rRNA (uracil1498-N3)-methyltransferase
MIRLWLTDLRNPNLNPKQAHYLFNVMRKKIGDEILVFNGEEWLAKLGKNNVQLIKKVRDLEVCTKRSIAVACIKKHRLEWLVEKVTEIGVDNIYLLETDRSQKAQYSLERMQNIAIEAAEQSNRLTIPQIHPPQNLSVFLNSRSDLVLCYQDGNASIDTHNPCCIVGPEGGWSERELVSMEQLPKLRLSDNILRAETAGIVATQWAIYQ